MRPSVADEMRYGSLFFSEMHRSIRTGSRTDSNTSEKKVNPFSNEVFSVKLTFKAILLSIIAPIGLAFPVLFFPLGGFSSSTDINGWCYVFFQVIYCLCGVYVMLLQFSLPMKGLLSWNFNFIYIPVIGSLSVFLLYYFLIIYCKSLSSSVMAQIPAMGIELYLFVIWTCYGVASIFYRPDTFLDDEIPPTNPVVLIEIPSPMSNAVMSDRSISVASLNPTYSVDHSQRNNIHPDTSHVQQRKKNGCFKFYLRVLMIAVVICGVFNWCIFFTEYFSSSPHSYPIGLFLLFAFVLQFSRFLLRFVARPVDSRLKAGSICMVIVVEMIISIYYDVFYRNLFSLVISWQEFAILTALSSVFEIFLYCFQVSQTYENFLLFLDQYIKSSTIQGSSSSSSAAAASTSTSSWSRMLVKSIFNVGYQRSSIAVERNSLLLGYRIVIKIATSVSYILFSIFLRYGYNAKYYEGNLTQEDSRTFLKIMAFILIAITIDLVIYAITNHFVVQRSGISLLTRFQCFFFQESKNDYQWVLVFTLGHILCDVMVAKINYSLLK